MHARSKYMIKALINFIIILLFQHQYRLWFQDPWLHCWLGVLQWWHMSPWWNLWLPFGIRWRLLFSSTLVNFYYICYIHIVTSIWQEISTHEHMHVYRFMLSEWRNALVNMYACMYKIIHEWFKYRSIPCICFKVHNAGLPSYNYTCSLWSSLSEWRNMQCIWNFWTQCSLCLPPYHNGTLLSVHRYVR